MGAAQGRSSSPTTRSPAPTRSSTAKVLAKAIERAGDVDLVLTATESTDGYTGTIPAQVAELLGWPSLTFAKHIEIGDGKVTIQRQTEAGYDVVEASLPAVVSVTAGVVEPRYPSFKGIMAAKNKPVDQVTVGRPRPRAPTRSAGPAPARRSVSVGAAPERAGRREDRGRRRGARADRRRSSSSSRSSETRPEATGEDDAWRSRKIWVFAEADGDKPTTRDARAADQGPRARRHRRGGATSAPTPTRSPAGARRARRHHGVRGRPRRRARRRRRRRRAGRARSASTQPDLVLFAQSYDGRDVVGRLSAKLDRPVLTNGTDLAVDGDKRRSSAPRSSAATRSSTPSSRATSPFLAAIRPKSFAAEPSGGGAAEVVAVDARRRRPRRRGQGARAPRRGARGAEARGGRRSSSPAAAGSAAPRLRAARRASSPSCSRARRARRVRSSTPAGCRTRSRSARPARR